MSGNEINFIRDGDRKDLTPFQLEKAVYFFHVNLDIEQKGYIQWEDAEFYLLFHLTTAGKENDADLEKEITSATRNVWDLLLNVWPNTDHNRMQKNQFLDIWAGLSKYIQETGNLPKIIEDWLLLGFKLYDLDDTGEIPPQSLQRLYSRMGLQIPQALIAYRMLKNNINGNLDFPNILSIIKSAITSNDPNNFSSFLIPGFNIHKKSGIRLSNDSQASSINKDDSEKDEPKSLPKERHESPPVPKENEQHIPIRKSPTSDKHAHEPFKKEPIHPVPTRIAPEAKEIPMMQNRNVSFYEEINSLDNKQFPRKSGRSDGSMHYATYQKERNNIRTPPREKVRPLSQESKLQENMRKSDVEFIYNVLKDMNIDPNDCEILVSDGFPKIDQSYGGRAMINQRNSHSAQDVPYVDIKEPKYIPNEYQSRTLPYSKSERTNFTETAQPIKSMSATSLHERSNYSANVANQNAIHAQGGQKKPIPNQYATHDVPNMSHNAERGPSYIKVTQVKTAADKVRPEQRDTLVEDILRKITPTVVKIVRDEIKKAKLITEPQIRHNMNEFSSMGPAWGRMPKGFERFHHPHVQKQHMEQRPQYAPDYYSSFYRPQRFGGPPSGQFGASTLPRMGQRPPHTAHIPRPGGYPGMWQRAPRPTKPKTSVDESKPEDLYFWQGPSGQSPSVNKMVFDKLLREKKTGTEKDEKEKTEDNDQHETESVSETKETKTEGSTRQKKPSEDMEGDANFMFFQTPFAPPPFFMTMMPPMFTPGLGAMHGMGPAMDGFVIIMDQNQDNEEQKEPKTD